jgi:hypothetical protein
MTKIIVQIGSERSRKRTQIVEAFVNDEPVSWDSGEGKFITSFAEAQQRGLRWYMSKFDLEDGDQIKLVVKTFITDAGKDEDLTFENVYYVNSSVDVEEISNPKVGKRGYPLLKGRLQEVYSFSAADEREQEIEDFLNEGF